MSTDHTPIRASDRLQDVFARDEHLIDILAGHSPQLAKLRHSPMRHVMARLTTVEQAARLCRLPAAVLVRDLNHALGIDILPEDAGEGSQQEAPSATETSTVTPTETPLSEIATAPQVELDVRDDLRNGREPFSRIIAAIGALQRTHVLHLRATFEPIPLFAVLKARGFAHYSIEHASDDWSIWFYRPEIVSNDTSSSALASDEQPVQEFVQQPSARTEPAGASSQTAAQSTSAHPASLSGETTGPEVWLDVRGLEPPEPMVRTLEALEELPAGQILVQVNVRVPQFLLPILRERGFEFEIDESQSDHIQVRIWRVLPGAA